MAGIRFINAAAPAAAYVAGSRAGAEQADRDARAMREQAQFDQERAVDRGLRSGIGQVYAEPAPAPSPVAAPPMPPAPPVPDNNRPVEGGQAAPQVASAPRPAAPSAAARTPGMYDSVIRSLANVPGGGKTALSLHQANMAEDQKQDQRRSQAELKAMEAIGKGDVATAQYLAQQYKLNLPPEIIQSREWQAKFGRMTNFAKQIGINDDTTALTFTQNYMEAIRRGASEQDALYGAAKAAQAYAAQNGGKKTSRWHWSNDRGAFFEEPTAENPQGRSVQPPGAPSRQFKPAGTGNPGAAGGDAGKRVQSTKYNDKGELVLVFRDGSTKLATDEAGKPIRGNDARKLAGTLVGKLVTDPLTRDPVGRARELAGQIHDAKPASPGAAPKRLKFDAQGNPIQQ